MRLLLTVLLLMSSTARVKRFLVEVLINQSWTTPQVIHSVETALLTWDVQNMSRVSLDEALESDMRFRVVNVVVKWLRLVQCDT
jgi:hypothetical protein